MDQIVVAFNRNNLTIEVLNDDMCISTSTIFDVRYIYNFFKIRYDEDRARFKVYSGLKYVKGTPTTSDLFDIAFWKINYLLATFTDVDEMVLSEIEMYNKGIMEYGKKNRLYIDKFYESIMSDFLGMDYMTNSV